MRNIQDSEDIIIDKLLKANPAFAKRDLTESIFDKIDTIELLETNIDVQIDKLIATPIEHNCITEKVMLKIGKPKYGIFSQIFSYTATVAAACIAIFATTSISINETQESNLESDFELICQMNEEIKNFELLVMQEELFDIYIN